MISLIYKKMSYNPQKVSSKSQTKLIFIYSVFLYITTPTWLFFKVLTLAVLFHTSRKLKYKIRLKFMKWNWRKKRKYCSTFSLKTVVYIRCGLFSSAINFTHFFNSCLINVDTLLFMYVRVYSWTTWLILSNLLNKLAVLFVLFDKNSIKLS